MAELSEPQAHLRYLDEFIGELACAPQMLEHQLLPNAKEVTETLAAFNAVRKHLKGFSFNDPSISLVSIGDGATPRIAALACFLTKWTCYSVDPLLPRQHAWGDIARLHVIPSKIEDFSLKAERAVVVAMHAHVSLPDALKSVNCPEIACVASPCCDYYDKLALSRPPDLEYLDWGIVSPHRTIRVWQAAAPLSAAAPPEPLSGAARYQLEPEEVRRELATKHGLSPAESSFLLKAGLLDYFTRLRSTGLDPQQCVVWCRLLSRAAVAEGKEAASVQPEWVAEIAMRPGWTLLQKKERLRATVRQGARITKPDDVAAQEAISPAKKKELESVLASLLAARPAMLEDLKSADRRAKVVHFMVGELLRATANQYKPAVLKAEVVLEFCKPLQQ